MKNCALILMVLIVILSGCSGGGKLSLEDVGIMKIDDEKQKITLGMSRAKAEDVLGKGEKNDYDGFEYDSGVTVRYRDGKISSIALSEESKGVYQTLNKIEIGTLRDKVEKIVDAKAASDKPLSYFYDTSSKSFITEREKLGERKSIEELEENFVLTFNFDENGYTSLIILSDQRAAKYGD